MQAPAASDGDGGAGNPEAVAAVRGAEVYVGYGVPPGVVAQGRGTLRWVHTATAGVWMSLPSLAGTGIVLTNSAAVHAEPIADWTITALGYFARGLDRMRALQAGERWASTELTALPVSVREFAELRLGVFGVGGIGGAIARRGIALGMGPAGKRPGRGLVVNVSRGELLDETALLDLLDASRLRGAALDVFTVEPLPPGHPFWRHPRVLVSPHVAAVTARFWDRETGLIVDNITRYLAGSPLTNTVDPEAGY